MRCRCTCRVRDRGVTIDRDPGIGAPRQKPMVNNVSTLFLKAVAFLEAVTEAGLPCTADRDGISRGPFR